jgi:hypothetical protein
MSPTSWTNTVKTSTVSRAMNALRGNRVKHEEKDEEKDAMAAGIADATGAAEAVTATGNVPRKP